MEGGARLWRGVCIIQPDLNSQVRCRSSRQQQSRIFFTTTTDPCTSIEAMPPKQPSHTFLVDARPSQAPTRVPPKKA